jgi:hypothetical protein
LLCSLANATQLIAKRSGCHGTAVIRLVGGTLQAMALGHRLRGHGCPSGTTTLSGPDVAPVLPRGRFVSSVSLGIGFNAGG